jgi:hypothetical protein
MAFNFSSSYLCNSKVSIKLQIKNVRAWVRVCVCVCPELEKCDNIVISLMLLFQIAIMLNIE